MTPWTREQLAADGFVGWVRWSACPDALAAIPQAAGGVYVIVKPDPEVERGFLVRSPASTFRGDPTVSREALDANRVPGASVVYIGKADHGRLRKRLVEYVDFSRGGKKRHSGGRLTWQLAEAHDLLVAWRAMPESESPIAEEARLIEAFRPLRQPPFANDPGR